MAFGVGCAKKTGSAPRRAAGDGVGAAFGPACETVDRSGGELPELRAARVAPGAVVLDGNLDDTAWRSAQCSGGFVNPGGGEPAPDSHVNGAAWAAWDDTNLYLAVRVEDPDPTSPFSAEEVDPHVWERSSGIELMLQPGDPGDNREYYEVQVDVNGAIWSTSFDDYNDPITGEGRARRFGHQEWQPSIATGVAVARDEGWYAIELALPWSQVRSTRTAVPPRAGDVWRANLYSFRDGQGDSLAWSPIRGEGNFHRSSRFGRLVFIE
ncbi:MAG: carbohydrate-binding family 9-like protein [Deltaproteobacteria bacterium]|nr:carbohydrate-binding family 9-like protein [Deltaproteobacteria bacterium]